MIKAITHVKVYDYHQYIENAYVLFDQKIIEVGPMDQYKPNLEYDVIEGHGYLLMPNFINGHSHIYSTFARGITLSYDPKNFLDILKQLWWKIDAKLDLEMIYDSGIVSAVDYLKHGVTTLIDHHASGVDIIGSLKTLSDALQKVGLRGIYAFETSDRFSVEQCIKENETFIKTHQSFVSSGLFGLHASMTLSDETLHQVKKHLHGAPIHVHVAESQLDGIDAEKKYHKKLIDRFNDFQLLNPDSLIAHGIYLEDDQLDILKSKKCVMAVNVTSNMNNSVGIPPVKRFMDRQLDVIVGTDGISFSMASEYLSLYYAMHHDLKDPTQFSLEHIKKLILNTYAYANRRLNTKLGQIKPSYDADFLMIKYSAPTPMHLDNALGHVFFGLFHGFRPAHVFVSGNWLLKNYEVDKNIMQLYEKAHISAHKLWESLK